MRQPQHDLRALQTLFFDVVMGKTPVADALTTGIFMGTPAFDAHERLSTYKDMVLWRQVDVLADDFPKTAALLGEQFFSVCTRYLASHPSSSPSVHRLGSGLSEFLSGLSDELPRLDIPAMAALEWLRNDVFDAPDEGTATLADLVALGEDAIPQARFLLHPSVRITGLAATVTPVWRALDQEQPAPEAIDAPELVAVYKKDFVVYHAVIDELEAQACEAARAGRNLAEICAVFADAGHEDPVQAAFGLVQRWFADHWVARVWVGKLD